MRYYQLILITVITFAYTILEAQQIQWADKVDFQFNQFGESDVSYSAHQVLGPPDAFPQGSIHENAFRLKYPGAFGTLVLQFANPQPIQELVIIENYLPGRIESISLFNENGKRYQFFEKAVVAEPSNARALLFNVPSTAYNVEKIEININSVPANGWVQIDAVGIANNDDVNAFKQDLQKYGDFFIEEAITFSAKKESIGARINSSFIDTKPVISPDGRSLYFVRQNHPDNVGGKNDPQDIYVSQWVNGEWGAAQNAGYPLNDKNANGVCSVSPDGKHIYVINDATRKDEPGISMATKNGISWSEPQPLVIHDFYNKSSFHDYFMSANEQFLLMAIENNEGEGYQDLYVSFKNADNTWSKPKSLGLTINTPAMEFSPYLAADNKTLYFASEGHQGFGEADIYYTKRLDDTWQNWLPPKNIGNAVNTVGWDGYYAVSARGDYAYFVSTGNVIDYFEDIYRIALPHEFKPEPVALVKGKVLHAETKEPLDARIMFENTKTGYEEGITSSNQMDGSYSLVLPLGDKYSYRAISKGYIPLSENIDLSNKSSYQEVFQDLLLYPIEKGITIRLNNLFFERGKARLLPESQPELERLLTIMNENPTLVIELGGHTDNQGSSKANMNLSFSRVEKVKEYLVENDIAKNRMITQGYGGSRPVASNADAETRKFNRRVEIKIMDY